ncbi:MAG: helix-turn-helix domain-containing protein [Lentisphaeria bacterium]|nr:MAG: helix-turn-helix domain-containing protein [Lentisphaeria bacterium]
MKTLQKALDLLELVSTRDGEAVTPKTASEKLGINQSSCVRLMQTLTDRGYLTQVSRRAGYTGGPALTAYGCRKTCCNTLVAAAGEQLRRLSTELGGRMINLSVAHRDRRYLIFQCGHTQGSPGGRFHRPHLGPGGERH